MKNECKAMIEERQYHSKYVNAADKAKLKTSLGLKNESAIGADYQHVEPWLLAITQCNQRTISIDAFVVQKEDFGIVVVFIDLLCVCIYIFFTYFLERKQEEYAAEFEK